MVVVVVGDLEEVGGDKEGPGVLPGFAMLGNAAIANEATAAVTCTRMGAEGAAAVVVVVAEAASTTTG